MKLFGTNSSWQNWDGSETVFGLRSDWMSVTFAHNWWLLALRGCFAILLGAFAIVLPFPTLGVLLLVFAAYLIVDGVVAIASGLRSAVHHKRWGLFCLEGVLDLLLASMLLLAPVTTLILFVYIAAFWAILTGAILAGAGFGGIEGQGRGWTVVAGLLSAIWGGLLLFFPVAGLLIMTWWLAGYAILFGVTLIALSIHLRGLRQPSPRPDQ